MRISTKQIIIFSIAEISFIKTNLQAKSIILCINWDLLWTIRMSIPKKFKSLNIWANQPRQWISRRQAYSLISIMINISVKKTSIPFLCRSSINILKMSCLLRQRKKPKQLIISKIPINTYIPIRTDRSQKRNNNKTTTRISITYLTMMKNLFIKCLFYILRLKLIRLLYLSFFILSKKQLSYSIKKLLIYNQFPNSKTHQHK